MKTNRNNSIRVINLSYPRVKELYDCYLQAKQENPEVAEAFAKKIVFETQGISRMGQEVAFPVSMRTLFEQSCEKFGEDTYVVDNNLLQRIINSLKSTPGA